MKREKLLGRLHSEVAPILNESFGSKALKGQFTQKTKIGNVIPTLYDLKYSGGQND